MAIDGSDDHLIASQILSSMRQTGENLRDAVRKASADRGTPNMADLHFGPAAVGELIGRSKQTLARAEEDGRLPPPKLTGNNRRYYNLEDLDVIRDGLGIHPGKAPDEDAVILSCQNFKGGVAKTTLSVHLSHYLALRGYRVLVVDCDPQASTTQMFGLRPEDLATKPDTLANFLSPRSSRESFSDCITPTRWPNVDIVPSSLGLQDTEWDLTAELAKSDATAKELIDSFLALRHGIAEIIKDYDVVVLDPPPAMGFLAVNAMAAAQGLVIPAPARQLDYLSTLHFLRTIEETFEVLDASGVGQPTHFIRVACSMFQPRNPGERDIWRIMQAAYHGRCLSEPIFHSEEIKSAAQSEVSLYELARPQRSHGAYKRSLANLNAAFKEIENDIRRAWPSTSNILSSEKAAA